MCFRRNDYQEDLLSVQSQQDGFNIFKADMGYFQAFCKAERAVLASQGSNSMVASLKQSMANRDPNRPPA